MKRVRSSAVRCLSVFFVIVLALIEPCFAQTDYAAPPPDATAMPTPSLEQTSSTSSTVSTTAIKATHLKHHPRHHRKPSRTHAYGKSKTSHTASAISVREAQRHLVNLNYYHGAVDGKMGPKTRTATKAFQRDHGLKPDGVIGKKTMAALIAADRSMPVVAAPEAPAAPPGPDFYALHPDFYGQYDQQFSDPMMLARQHSPVVQGVPSKYAQISVSEVPSGAMKKYDVTVNGKSILLVDNQPSVIGISSTYNLSNEDVVLLSTFNNSDPVCSYNHYLLTLKEGGSELLPLGNCTREYKAVVKENSLWVMFPEKDDARVVGATFRYEPGDLQKL